ncbi:MAG: leucine-rich repeat domain-containing protein, partial [Clostridia bacterium]
NPYPYYEIKTKDDVTLPNDVVIPNGYNNAPVCMIADSCCMGQTTITSVVLPKYLIVLASKAFSGCTNLSTVTIEDGATIPTFSTELFKDCVSLTTINLPDSVSKITSNCFSGCSNLSTLNINKESKLINIVSPTIAFIDTAITSLHIPANLVINSVLKNKEDITINLIRYTSDNQ